MAAMAAAPARATNALRRIFTISILTIPKHSATGLIGQNLRNSVGLAGFEPATSPLSGVRSNRLSYSPKAKPSGEPTFGGSRQANENAEVGSGAAGGPFPPR